MQLQCKLIYKSSGTYNTILSMISPIATISRLMPSVIVPFQPEKSRVK